MDLDQALHLERRRQGLPRALRDRRRRRVRRARRPRWTARRTSAARRSTRRTERTPLPARALRGRGSLLPDETRPAILWTMDLDETGEGIKVDVRRALVRSREKLDYDSVQRSLDNGSASDSLQLLREVGLLRQEREARQGGVQLRSRSRRSRRRQTATSFAFRDDASRRGLERADLADDRPGGGRADARRRASASSGRCPRRAARAVERLRRTATALGIDWPEEQTFADVIRDARPEGARTRRLPRRVDRAAPRLRLRRFRRRGAVAAARTRASAPRTRTRPRRCAGSSTATSARSASPSTPERTCPSWAREALPGLPQTMEESNKRAQQYEAGIISAVEAAVLEAQASARSSRQL